MLFVLIFKKFQWVHKYVTSDIPGNPHAFDDSIISMMRTLPEPSNTNVVYTGLPLDKGPILLSGTLPGGRCNSFNIYGSGTSDTPGSLDACDVTLTDNQFHVIITNEADTNTLNLIKNSKSKKYSILLANKAWKMGFFAMRNYLVHPGTLVKSPTVRYFKLNNDFSYDDSDKLIIRRSQDIITGPCGVVNQYAPNIKTIQRFVAIQVLYLLFPLMKHVVMDMLVSPRSVPTPYVAWDVDMANQVIMCVLSMSISIGLRAYLYEIGRKGLQRVVTGQTCGNKMNQFHYTSLESGSKASQPSVLHRYWVMPFQLNSNEELTITAQIDPKNQKYWSIVVYDEFGLCLPQYVYDANYVSNTPNIQADINSGSFGPYEVDVTLSGNCPQGSPSKSSMYIDLKHIRHKNTKQCNGYVLFRLVHPTLDENGNADDIMEYSSPKACVCSVTKDVTDKKRV